ncbi:MAG TPA: hypothetical protein PLU87_04950 [Sedimentisphaerales bacterium]|nr:hypothetical protein [Sedimentisphaerales bacterium]HRS11218.1 hypothetical protein [Sedimentisphaerales bacterium]HRV47796.1 hypothetical protein [Sedimentisphaerales bacterium]
MNARRCGTLLLVLAVWPFSWIGAQESAPVPAQGAAQAEIDKQVRIYKSSLVDGKDEQTRLDAATLLLFSESREARKEVLDILRDPNHPEARAAICKALIVARDNKQLVSGKEELVEPLMGVLSTENDPERAELAAQTLLIFAYETVQRRLEMLISDVNAPDVARLNAIRALKYQPDDRAIFRLMNLLDNPHPDLASESRRALALLGIRVPEDPNALRALNDGLQRRGPEAFLNNPAIMRNWLISRENRIRELTTALASWEQRYMVALGRLYDVQPDEKARSDFLAQQLASNEPAVKLWALGKLEELRKGTGKAKLSEQVESLLLGLISHRDKRVRLKTANLLSLVWELNSTSQLLDQLQVEEDPDVRHGLFVALGNVCYYASLPTSGVKIPDDVRRRTLELAVRFLDLSDAEKVRSGADVVWRLLEQDGLKPEEIDKYLAALANRYGRTNPTANNGLRAELLGAMARLCAERSRCRVQAAKLYRPVFDQALGDDLEAIRLAGLEGLANIDKAAAIAKARVSLVNDASARIRARLVDLAGEVGGQEDLDWLSKRLGTEGEGEAAWQAMLKVLRRSTAEVVARWAMDPQADPGIYTPARRAALLALLEQKAQAENKADLLREARTRLFGLYVAAGDLAKATECGNLLWEATRSAEDRRATTAGLVEMCLEVENPAVDLVGSLLERHLAAQDLEPDSPIAAAIDAYLKRPELTDPTPILAKLRQIKVKDPDARKVWRKQLVEWETFAKARKPVEGG